MPRYKHENKLDNAIFRSQIIHVERGNKCEICGKKLAGYKYNTETRKFERLGKLVGVAHHRDGNHGNNTRDNLVLLCRNCHQKLKGGKEEITKQIVKLRQEIANKEKLLDFVK